MVDNFLKWEQYGVAHSNRNLLANQEWPRYQSQELAVTFDGGTTNGIGDESGSSNPYTMFTVTGIIEISIIAVVTTDLVGAATLECGTTTTTAGLIAQVANTTTMDAPQIWHDATVNATIELSSVITRKIISEDIKLLITTADITAGVIKFIVRWAPISADGNLVVV